MSKKPIRRAVIITALPVEREAVLAHLSSATEEPSVRGSIYRRGVFEDRSEPWEVIVAEIGAGNERAAAEAERVLGHYKPDVALFVGIAGAVKDLTHGDVVASTKVYNYESGKHKATHFETRPETELPTYSLLARARHEAGETHWRERIRSDTGTRATSPPKAQVGPIAAGPKVLASTRTATYKFIRKHYGDAVAVEMEGHGFLLSVRMNQPVQGIVVRGISDRISDKNSASDLDWQPIAARHAAAFAYQLLAKLSDTVTGHVASSAQLDAKWQHNHLEDVRATAGPRYTPKLRVDTPLHDIFEALCHTNGWYTSIRARKRKFNEVLKAFLRCVTTTSDQGWGAPFPEQLRDIGSCVADQVRLVGDALRAMANFEERASPPVVREAVTAALPKLRELHGLLREEFESHHGEGTADSASFRQFQAEYMMAFPAANLDAAKDLLTALEEMEDWTRSGGARAAGAKGILLTGAAGVGKTHGICDIAHDRAARGLPTVVLFAEQFASTEVPWEQMRQLLGFGSMGRDELLALFDGAGEASGGHLLLCIDGLNESRPRRYWRDWLASLVTQFARFNHIRLCVSCRSTYLPVSIPENHGLEPVEHVGFAGIEFTACRQFFEHYALQPPVAPTFHPEFANPLFLRLACETLRAAGETRMPTGWHGINTAAQAFFRQKNEAFAREHERNKQERIPQRAMHEFMSQLESARRPWLRWSEAVAAFRRVQPADLIGVPLVDWLVREGLLIADVDPDGIGPDAEEIVRVAFERLGDHLLAERILETIPKGGLRAAIVSGALSYAFDDDTAVLNNRGLIEALSIQCAEHPEFSCELIDAVPAVGPRDSVLRATISALHWRNPEYMTPRTRKIAWQALIKPGLGHETFNNLLAIATHETPLDARWLHARLSDQSMPHRDGFLCGFLHDQVGRSSNVERLLGASFEVEADSIPKAVCLRWAILLLWFCVAADRRVRDRATKGLIAITQSNPRIWSTLIKRFSSIDDEYVFERCLCAAYGTLLRTRNTESEKAVASATYKAVFVHPQTFQNALIRDHARCIIELAALDGALPASIQLERIRPPYDSEWPITIPPEQDVERYEKERREYPKLYVSCLEDDFFRYTMSALMPYEHALSRKEMGRWILHHIIEDMGYGGMALASYDHNMMYHHGAGRGRPGWAERIGKKYQWIALSRLMARLADHVHPEVRSWEPEFSADSLVYERGRDIDPSLLLSVPPPESIGPGWWLPQEYDFAQVGNSSDAEWTSSLGDIPRSEQLLRPLERDSTQWQLLQAYPKWSAKVDDDDDESLKPYREIWMQIRGYFVEDKSARRVFNWMRKQRLMDGWLGQPSGFYEGFVGEYPWGIPFRAYSDSDSADEHYRVGKCPAHLVPVCKSLSSGYEEDAYQARSITIHVPARTFFRKNNLRWDGLSGYCDVTARLRFLDPSLLEPGPPALLVDRAYLLDHLRENGLSLVWAVLGEKLIMRMDNTAPRLEFSCAHLLDHTGSLQTSDLMWKTN